jgi:hypothetical protein
VGDPDVIETAHQMGGAMAHMLQKMGVIAA